MTWHLHHIDKRTAYGHDHVGGDLPHEHDAIPVAPTK